MVRPVNLDLALDFIVIDLVFLDAFSHLLMEILDFLASHFYHFLDVLDLLVQLDYLVSVFINKIVLVGDLLSETHVLLGKGGGLLFQDIDLLLQLFLLRLQHVLLLLPVHHLVSGLVRLIRAILLIVSKIFS